MAWLTISHAMLKGMMQALPYYYFLVAEEQLQPSFLLPVPEEHPRLVSSLQGHSNLVQDTSLGNPGAESVTAVDASASLSA